MDSNSALNRWSSSRSSAWDCTGWAGCAVWAQIDPGNKKQSAAAELTLRAKTCWNMRPPETETDS
jgi:hypothetical protein